MEAAGRSLFVDTLVAAPVRAAAQYRTSPCYCCTVLPMYGATY